MVFENLVVQRLISHVALKRTPFSPEAEPEFSSELLDLGPEGTVELQNRITTALGKGSRSMQLSIGENAEGSTFDLCARLLDAEDGEFISLSQRLASKLSNCQTAPSVKSGLAVIMTGTIGFGENLHRIAIVVKAEKDSGFVGTMLKFVSELFLGTHQKLYKIGCFVELEHAPKPVSSDGIVEDPGPRAVSDFCAFVFDHLLTQSGDSEPSQYFYRSFMGCALAESAKRQTAQFYQHTADFINGLNLPPSERFDYQNRLNVYLKSEKPQVTISDFADEFLRQEHRALYRKHMRERKFEDRAVAKDVSLIKNKLRLRRVVFSSQIKLSGPEEAFTSSLRIGKTEGDWTTIEIAGDIKEQ